MKELKDIAKTIKVNFIRTGFNPITEQTDFIVIINGVSFDFHCGLLACIPDKEVPSIISSTGKKTVSPLKLLKQHYHAQHTNKERVLDLILSGQLKAINNMQHIDIWQDISEKCSPTAWDFLYCLQSDCRAAEMSFDDFCSDFGYNNDSIKDLAIYNACCESSQKLKKAIGVDLYREVIEANPE